MDFINQKGINEWFIHFRQQEHCTGGLNYAKVLSNIKNKRDICAKNLPSMAKYPQHHLEILQVPVAVLAIDTTGHLPITSRGHQWALKAICMHISYVFAIPWKEKSADNVVQAYLSGIFTHKGGSIAILSANSTGLKNTALNKACEQLDIKRLFSNQFHPGNSTTISLREHLLNF